MRVLFTTWAWPSHYFPLVPLAWALRSAGHEVLMTSQPDLLPPMRASGLPAVAVGRCVDAAAAHRKARRQATAEAPRTRPQPAGQPRWSANGESVADRVAAGPLGADPDNPDLARGHEVMRLLEAETRSIFVWLRHRQATRSLGGPPL